VDESRSGYDVTGPRADLFARKYYGANLEWQQKAGSSALWDYVQTSSVAVSVDDDRGQIYVAGGYQHWARLGPSSLSGGGSANMFVAVLAP